MEVHLSATSVEEENVITCLLEDTYCLQIFAWCKTSSLKTSNSMLYYATVTLTIAWCIKYLILGKKYHHKRLGIDIIHLRTLSYFPFLQVTGNITLNLFDCTFNLADDGDATELPFQFVVITVQLVSCHIHFSLLIAKPHQLARWLDCLVRSVNVPKWPIPFTQPWKVREYLLHLFLLARILAPREVF